MKLQKVRHNWAKLTAPSPARTPVEQPQCAVIIHLSKFCYLFFYGLKDFIDGLRKLNHTPSWINYTLSTFLAVILLWGFHVSLVHNVSEKMPPHLCQCQQDSMSSDTMVVIAMKLEGVPGMDPSEFTLGHKCGQLVAVIKISMTFMFSVNTWKTRRKIRIFFFNHILVFCIFSVRMMLCSQFSSLRNLKITSWLMRTMSFTSDLKQLILCYECAGEGELKPERHCFWKLSFLGFCFCGSERFWYSTSFFSPSGVFWKATEQEMEVGEHHPKLCR